MTLLEYKEAFANLHSQLEKEYGSKVEVHIYEENDATYGRWVTTIEIKFWYAHHWAPAAAEEAWPFDAWG